MDDPSPAGPDQENVPDSSQGVRLDTIQKLAKYWTRHDWRKVETEAQFYIGTCLARSLYIPFLHHICRVGMSHSPHLIGWEIADGTDSDMRTRQPDTAGPTGQADENSISMLNESSEK